MATLADGHPANTRTTTARPPQHSWPIRLVFFLLMSLCLSILIEWLGMAFFYEEVGAAHSEAMLVQEVTYLNVDFREAAFGSDPAVLITTLAGRAYYYTMVWTHLESGLHWLTNRFGFTAYVSAFLNMVQLFFVRLGILTFSLPVFVLFAIVGVATGLSMRDIRRWSGGREFGGVYHIAKRFAPKALLVAWLVYLTVPISMHPNLIVLPCAILFGVNMLIITASFKKYL